MASASSGPAQNRHRYEEDQDSLLGESIENQLDCGNVENNDTFIHHETRPIEQSSYIAATLPLIIDSFRRIFDSLLRFVRHTTRRQRSDSIDWSVCPTMILSCVRNAALFLLPSPLRRRYFPTELDRWQPNKTYPTAFLDGLRGYSALSVFLYHFTVNIYGNILYGYGAPPSKYGHNLHWIQLPIIRLLFAGTAAVSVFFVVSGFALSIRPIAQMRSRDDSKLMSTLSSSAFRRAFRLFLPCIVSTFIVFLCVRLGVFELTRFIHDNEDWMEGRSKSHLKIKGSFSIQFRNWLWEAIDMIQPFQWANKEFGDFTNHFDSHLWTISIEFRASLALFLSHMAVAQLMPSIRMLLFAVLIYYSVITYTWEMVLFWSGTILAELHMDVLNPKKLNIYTRRSKMMWQTIFSLILILGLILVSYPEKKGAKSPGYRLIARGVPSNWKIERHFWQGWGAVLLVLGVQSLPTAANFMGSGFSHYLGQISFALYLMHGLSNRTVGYTCLFLAWKVTGRATDVRIFLGYLLACCFHIPITLWIADIFWRAVDIPTVDFAKWLESTCSRKLNPLDNISNRGI